MCLHRKPKTRTAILGASVALLACAQALSPASALAAIGEDDSPLCLDGVGWFNFVVGEDCGPLSSGSGTGSSNSGSSGGSKESRPVTPVNLPPETYIVRDPPKEIKRKEPDRGSGLRPVEPRNRSDQVDDNDRDRGGRSTKPAYYSTPAKRRYPDWRNEREWLRAAVKAEGCEVRWDRIQRFYEDDVAFKNGEMGFWRWFFTAGDSIEAFEGVLKEWKEGGCADLVPPTVY